MGKEPPDVLSRRAIVAAPLASAVGKQILTGIYEAKTDIMQKELHCDSFLFALICFVLFSSVVLALLGFGTTIVRL